MPNRTLLSRRVPRLVVDATLFGHHPLAPIMQRVAQRILGGPREVSFELTDGPAKGLMFSCMSTHRYFFTRGDYERDLVSPLESLIRPGMKVFEIGAHYGYWALVLSRLCGSGGKVWAFEPVPQNRVWLEKNLKMNAVANVEIVPFAASDSCGEATMVSDGTTSSLREGSGTKVGLTTIDTFVRGHDRPDFMLIDVEGFAGQVLAGAAGIYAEKFVPVICEIHHPEEEASFNAFMRGRKIERLDRGTGFTCRVLAT